VPVNKLLSLNIKYKGGDIMAWKKDVVMLYALRRATKYAILGCETKQEAKRFYDAYCYVFNDLWKYGQISQGVALHLIKQAHYFLNLSIGK